MKQRVTNKITKKKIVSLQKGKIFLLPTCLVSYELTFEFLPLKQWKKHLFSTQTNFHCPSRTLNYFVIVFTCLPSLLFQILNVETMIITFKINYRGLSTLRLLFVQQNFMWKKNFKSTVTDLKKGVTTKKYKCMHVKRKYNNI